MSRKGKEEWGNEYDDTFEGECDCCGDHTILRNTLDPFSLEINEEEVDRTWCRECYLNRKDDI